VLYQPLKWVARHRRPLARRKSASAAAVIGLLFGGIGVGLYFRSFLDFVLCCLFTVVAFAAFAISGSPMTLLLYVSASALYGFHRVRASNVKLATAAEK
jgi:hypothetical protein